MEHSASFSPRFEHTTEETVDVWADVPVPDHGEQPNRQVEGRIMSEAEKLALDALNERFLNEELANALSGSGSHAAPAMSAPVLSPESLTNSNNSASAPSADISGLRKSSSAAGLAQRSNSVDSRGGTTSASPTPAPRSERPPPLSARSYRDLLGAKLEHSLPVQAMYKMEVPLGKAETFLAEFWKHEPSLLQYCTRVSLCKSLDGPPATRGSGEATGSAKLDTKVLADKEEGKGKLCRACVAELRAEPCKDFVAGPLRRVKEVERDDRARHRSSDVQDEFLTPAKETTGMSPRATGSTSPMAAGSAGGSPAVVPSPSKKKNVARAAPGKQGAWHKRLIKFVERRCRVCDHLPYEHALEGSAVATFTLSLDCKTRAAWDSSFASFDDVASEAMKDCIARVYEPTVLRVVDDRRVDPAPEPERYFLDDEDPASESNTADRGEDMLEGRNFFRFSLWKAQNLPTRADGTPHTWIVQAKYGKSILTSSSKTDNDPVWKEHFHFKFKDGRKLYLRIIASDEPKLHEGRVKVSVASESRSRSGTSARVSFQEDRSSSPRRNTSSLGRRGGSEMMMRHSDDRAASVPSSAGSWGRRFSERMPQQAALSDAGRDARISVTDDGTSGEELWASARQWRSITPAENKGGKHGQMLVSLLMNVQLLDPLALHSVVMDEEPEGVNDVLPAGQWALFADVQRELATGDVVLFVGHGWVGSTMQKYHQRPWLHIGMVMVFSEYDMILVWEFTPNKSLEVSNKINGQFRLNVQLTDINTKMRDPRYYRVAVRKLVCDRTPEMMKDLMKLKKQLETEGFSGFLPSVVESRDHLPPSEDLSAIFSAELLATAFRVMGVLPRNGDMTLYGPSFWTQDGPLALNNGAQLLPCQHIERVYDPVSRSMALK